MKRAFRRLGREAFVGILGVALGAGLAVAEEPSAKQRFLGKFPHAGPLLEEAPELAEDFFSPEPEERLQVFRTLQSHPPAHAIPILVGSVCTEPEVEVRKAAFHSLSHMVNLYCLKQNQKGVFRGDPKEDLGPHFRRLLKLYDEGLKEGLRAPALLSILVNVHRNEKFSDELPKIVVRKLKKGETDPSLYWAAGVLKIVDAKSILVQRAAGGDKADNLFWVLGELKAEEAIPTLLPLLRDRSPAQRASRMWEKLDWDYLYKRHIRDKMDSGKLSEEEGEKIQANLDPTRWVPRPLICDRALAALLRITGQNHGDYISSRNVLSLPEQFSEGAMPYGELGSDAEKLMAQESPQGNFRFQFADEKDREEALKKWDAYWKENRRFWEKGKKEER